MNETMKERAARTAGRWMLGFSFFLPLMVGAAAPSVSITLIQATPQTNYNGSAIVVTFTGNLPDYSDVALKVGNTSYPGTVSGDKMTFAVPGTAVTAGNVYASTITTTDTSGTYTIGARWLYQGKPVAGGRGTNAWFKTWAESTTVNNEDGAWKVGDVTKDPSAVDSKIIIDEDAEGNYDDFVFTPVVADNSGQVVVADMVLSFDAALDETVAVAGAQAAIRVVTVGNTYRFAAFADGVWKTNTTMTACLGAAYPVRTTFDYREVPATVTYEVLTNGSYKLIASGVSGTTKLAIERFSFNGTGKISVMTGSNIVDSVDASLVKDTEHPANKYANIGAALANNVTNLTLLWNTAWQPTTGAGAFTISKGVYSWYYTPKDGLLVRENPDGSLSVVTDYWEVMNLLGGEETTYMYFTNAVISGGTTVSNLYLLRDVVLGETLTVDHDIWFNGESNILSGAGLTVGKDKTFTIVGGCIGILGKDCGGEGKVALTGGRYKTTPGWVEPTDYTFADLAFAVREGYTKQLMKSDDAPKTGQELLPVTDANGESVSIVLNTSWAADVTGKSTAAEQSAALSEVQTNGMTRLDNEILGLTKAGGAVATNNIPVIQPVQSSSTTQIKFSLGNVNKDTISASGAKVTYRVVTSSKPGGKDGAVSSYVAPSAEVQMPLPDSGVQYYLIEVDTGAVK